MAHGLPLSWLDALEKGLPKPDKVIVLDVSPGISLGRKRKRRDVHEGNLVYLSRVRKEYVALAKRYGWKTIDGAQDSQTVRRLVWMTVALILRREPHRF
jgi:thymidylate kinase